MIRRRHEPTGLDDFHIKRCSKIEDCRLARPLIFFRSYIKRFHRFIQAYTYLFRA